MTTTVLDRPTDPPRATAARHSSPPEVTDDITRRGLLTGTAALLALAACGDESAAPEPSAAPATRTFRDITGAEIQVPDAPQRIVAIHDGNGGLQVLELGLPLVGMATRGGGFDPGGPVEYDLSDVEPVGEYYTPDIEAITALRPDLIVGEGFKGAGMDAVFDDPSVQEKLERLAPVVYIDAFRPVEEVMADFAELLGEAAQERFAELREAYEVKLAELRAELDPVADRLSAAFVVMRADSMLGLRGRAATPLTVTLTALGIEQPPVTEAEGPDGFPKLSLELTSQVDADVIFYQGPGDDPEFFADYTDNPLWQQLDAVQADQVLAVDARMDPQTYATYSFVLDEIRQPLVAADPDVFAEPDNDDDATPSPRAPSPQPTATAN